MSFSLFTALTWIKEHFSVFKWISKLLSLVNPVKALRWCKRQYHLRTGFRHLSQQEHEVLVYFVVKNKVKAMMSNSDPHIQGLLHKDLLLESKRHEGRYRFYSDVEVPLSVFQAVAKQRPNPKQPPDWVKNLEYQAPKRRVISPGVRRSGWVWNWLGRLM